MSNGRVLDYSKAAPRFPLNPSWEIPPSGAFWDAVPPPGAASFFIDQSPRNLEDARSPAQGPPIGAVYEVGGEPTSGPEVQQTYSR
jgi:hypothetical protein